MHPEEKSLLLVGLEPESSALTSRPPATLVTSKLQLSCYFKQFRCHFFSNPSFISVISVCIYAA